MDTPQRIIETLGLAPHPEGGWYRETWRAAPSGGAGRSAGTAIHFLLEGGQRSHWHRVDAEELWLWHAGSPVEVQIAESGTHPARSTLLGGDVLLGQAPQCRVPAQHWQATEARLGWALVSCVVVPGFDFGGFTLAPPEWQPGR